MSLSAEEMRDIVDKLYAATGAGDWATAESMLTDDFLVSEADGLPMAGIFRGKGALRELYTKVMGLVDVVSLDRGETMTGTSQAACVVTFRFADPALEPGELLELFRFRGGQVCEIKPYYFDPATMVAAHAAFLAKSTA